MHKLFRKKGNAVPESKPKPIEQQEIPFSINHPNLANCVKMNWTDILNNPNKFRDFQKLNTIFKKFPKLPNYITFYYENDVNPNYIEFRQQALKTQIKTGIEKVLQFESLISKDPDLNPFGFNKSIFQSFLYLDEVRSKWNQYLKEFEVSQQIKKEINEIASKKLNCYKNISIQLTSLLTSIDSIPINCIPVVNFAATMHSKEELIKQNSECTKLMTFSGIMTKRSRNDLHLLKMQNSEEKIDQKGHL